MPFRIPDIKKEEHVRLYRAVASWTEENNNEKEQYRQEFIISALNEKDALIIAHNHLPMTLTSDTKPTADDKVDLSLQDYGMPLPNRTYYSSPILPNNYKLIKPGPIQKVSSSMNVENIVKPAPAVKIEIQEEVSNPADNPSEEQNLSENTNQPSTNSVNSTESDTDYTDNDFSEADELGLTEPDIPSPDDMEDLSEPPDIPPEDFLDDIPPNIPDAEEIINEPFDTPDNADESDSTPEPEPSKPTLFTTDAGNLSASQIAELNAGSDATDEDVNKLDELIKQAKTTTSDSQSETPNDNEQSLDEIFAKEPINITHDHLKAIILFSKAMGKYLAQLKAKPFGALSQQEKQRLNYLCTPENHDWFIYKNTLTLPPNDVNTINAVDEALITLIDQEIGGN